jgi:hypothetical protein
VKDDPPRPKRLKTISDTIADNYDEIRTKASRVAQDAGYGSETFRKVGTYLETLPDDPLLGKAEEELKLHRDLTAKQLTGIDELYTSISSISSTAHLTLSDVLSTASTVQEVFTIEFPPDWSRKASAYADKLELLDPEIARIYRSVSEIFYGTYENPDRAAMFQLRQAYDHFFAKLAPDDEVRSSEYFRTKKEPGKENSVHRIERIKYAAYTRVKNKDVANLLISSADSLLATYKKLQKAHERGTLRRGEVEAVVVAMLAALEGWIDALEL